MIIEIDPDGAEVRKRAEDSAEVARLGREAVVLAAARHPGVVQLLGWEGTTLRLQLVDGVALTSAVAAGPAVAVATTLADLHEIGIVHGAITAEHILVDRHGDLILCGFGRARTGVPPGGPETAADVAALAAVLAARTEDGAQRAVLARAAAPGRRRPPTARQLAQLLASPPAAGGPKPSPRRRPPSARRLAPRPTAPPPAASPKRSTRRRPPSAGQSAPRPAAPPTAAGPKPPPRRRKIRAPGGRIVAVALALAAAAGAGAVALAAQHHRAGAPCPAADRGCRPLPHPGGALSIEQDGRRYRVGQPDDVVVLGRWNCGAVRAALLQPGSGTIWVFDQWAPGTARLVTHVPGAASLRVDPGPNGCDHLQVIGPRGAAAVVHPDPGS